MPNTLAHMGAQALVTRGLIDRADLGWVWLGALLPDLPWILQRAVTALPVEIDPIDLRLYAAVQSALLFCLVAAAGFAMFASRPGRVFAILALGSLLHLLLDATQTKWGNGVLLVAPLNWKLLSFDLYWPEDLPSYALSLLGFLYVVWAGWRIGPGALGRWSPPLWRIAAAAALFALYALGPFSLIPAAEAANVHNAAALRAPDTRPGQAIEFDRAGILRMQDGVPRLAIWTGETLALSGLPIPPSAELVSVRGHFTATDTVKLTGFHLHPPGRRDRFTFLGLGLMTIWWGWGLIRSPWRAGAS
jgi:hypothetical protein